MASWSIHKALTMKCLLLLLLLLHCRPLSHHFPSKWLASSSIISPFRVHLSPAIACVGNSAQTNKDTLARKPPKSGCWRVGNAQTRDMALLDAPINRRRAKQGLRMLVCWTLNVANQSPSPTRTRPSTRVRPAKKAAHKHVMARTP